MDLQGYNVQIMCFVTLFQRLFITRAWPSFTRVLFIETNHSTIFNSMYSEQESLISFFGGREEVCYPM